METTATKRPRNIGATSFGFMQIEDLGFDDEKYDYKFALVNERGERLILHGSQIDTLIEYANEKRGIINLKWSANDVIELRKDLNHKQAYEVLEYAQRKHNAEYGISYDTLRDHVNELFPNPDYNPDDYNDGDEG